MSERSTSEIKCYRVSVLSKTGEAVLVDAGSREDALREGGKLLDMPVEVLQVYALDGSDGPGDYSPWGVIGSRKRLADGIWWVSTPSHGGMWLSTDRVIQLRELVSEDEYPAFTGDDNWWEEDVDWIIPQIIFSQEIEHRDAFLAAERQLIAMAERHGGKYQSALNRLSGVLEGGE